VNGNTPIYLEKLPSKTAKKDVYEKKKTEYVDGRGRKESLRKVATRTR